MQGASFNYSTICMLGHRFLISTIKSFLYRGEIFMLPENVVLLKISIASLDDNILCPYKTAFVGETFVMFSYGIRLLNGPPFMNKYSSQKTYFTEKLVHKIKLIAIKNIEVSIITAMNVILSTNKGKNVTNPMINITINIIFT